MTRIRLGRPGRPPLGPGRLCVVLAGALALASCSAGQDTAGRPPPPLLLDGPLVVATSFASGGSAVALVPMGDLGEPRNTFWELVARSRAGGPFVLDTPPGVADNGGLVAAPAGSGGAVVGVVTSQLLGFSPTARSDRPGGRWSPGTLAQPLAPLPGALAAGSYGVAALVGLRGSSVELSRDGRGGWRVVGSVRDLRRLAPRSCGLGALTAVGPSQPPGGATSRASLAVAGACAGRGQIALFAATAGSAAWTALPVRLGRPLRASEVEVAAIEPSQGGYLLLLASRGPGGSALWTARVVPGSGTLTLSAPLELGARRLRALATSPSPRGARLLVLAAGGSPASPSEEEAAAIGPGQRSWQLLAPPPPGTEGVAWGPHTAVALVVHRSRLAVDRLGGDRWHMVQSLEVPVPYGSSG
ncbi:MAG TPA: hypothetical protein VKU92_08410 [Acidimicrobiales bacterium]|nr:hypothetical protein [Acidimicrobiales bacterium]